MKQISRKLNAVAAVLLAFVLVLLIGFATLRNRVRLDLSDRNYYKLSEKTEQMLERLDQEVRVTVFFQQEHMLYDDIENLLEEYQYRSRNFHIEWVDPLRDPARAEKLGNQYGITPAQVVVFDINGKSRSLYQADLAEMQVPNGRRDPVMTAFKGEQAFSSAIYALIEGDTPVIYFLLGHGEHRVTDFDQMVGFSDIGSVIFRDNLEIKELVLTGEKAVPADAAAVVIAGPMQKMSSIEVEMLEEYLSQSGRLFVLLDAMRETGLEEMLRRWGVVLRNDVVVDPDNTLRGSDVHIRWFNPHPISMKMNAIVQFLLPRSIEPPRDAKGNYISINDQQTVTPLFFTSEASWSETQVTDNSATFNADTGDRMGPLSLGVAIERGADQEELDVQIDPSKMVVFGDSDFVSNGAMVGGNADLFMSALNWLLDRDETLAIAPKPIEKVKLGLSSNQFRVLGWVNIAGIPCIAVVLGLLVGFRRRK
jgi:ABC-type uncharacterized transport system involved in gliding motility auxiliary subunit